MAPMRECMAVFLCRRLDDWREDVKRKLYVAHCEAHRAKDQCFSRARVLIQLPMKNTAYEVMKTVVALAVKPGPSVQNRERFEAEFAQEDEGEIKSEKEGDIPYAGRGLAKLKRRSKPADHRRLFRGNTEDDFKLGICISKKSIKLHADFNASDLIIASPLGLRRALLKR